MSGSMSVFDIASRAMSAQVVRLNTVASNMANAGTVSTTKEGAFRALKPVFSQVSDAPGVSTVRVDQVVQSATEPTRRHDPSNPLADKNGDVWDAGVDSAAELVDMIETQRAYEVNSKMISATDDMLKFINQNV